MYNNEEEKWWFLAKTAYYLIIALIVLAILTGLLIYFKEIQFGKCVKQLYLPSSKKNCANGCFTKQILAISFTGSFFVNHSLSRFLGQRATMINL
jgi:hypothetical protein